ncbi:hypothetical protein BX070DRAFT_125510 [Coemansia spiralis]|nr:hypothetical protein BX070DRAFT_125510 [Coemansia spiralis]
MHAKSASVTFAENCRSDSALALHSRNSIQEYPVLQTVPLHVAKSESPQRKLASALLSPLDTKLTKGCSMQLQLMMPAGKLHSADIHSAGLISPKLPISPALSPMEDSKDSFTPYYMSTAQPRAPELQRSSYAPLSSHKQAQTATNASHISSTAAAESPAGLASPGISTGQLTPNTGNNSMELDGRLSDVSTATRIRRSLSTLLTRSSSMLLRKGNSSDSRRAGKRISQEATIPEHTALISSAPATPSACLPAIMVRSSRATSANRKNAAALSPDGAMQSSLANHSSDAALPAAGMAFSSSRFNLAVVNGIVSPLIRNSMVHLKVVMNANTIVIVPMVRTEVFARARERILTKLFGAGYLLWSQSGASSLCAEQMAAIPASRTTVLGAN